MKHHLRSAIGLVLAILGLLAANANAQTTAQTGVTLLRQTTTNLYGNGIVVGQAEADVTASPLGFEVNPANVGRSPSIFTYVSADGVATTYPNLLGTNSWHAENVAWFFYSPGSGAASSVAHVDNVDANFFITNYVGNPLLPPCGDAVVNQSFTFGNEVTNDPAPDNDISVSDAQQVDSAYDDYANQNGTLFVSAVNNVGSVSPPGTAYNSIGVAAYGAGATSSIGPTVDNGRCKPDITAPAGATSFSTPQVSGAATVLLQAGERGDGGGDTNSASDMRTLKALLLTGAVKPTGWTNGPNAPLDARYGSGLLNLFNAYHLLAGLRQSNCVTTAVAIGGSHPPASDTNTIGSLNAWDFNTNTSSALADTVNHYYFNATNGHATTHFLTTATLVWNRQLGQTNINHLRLFLYRVADSNLVACSTSLVDNVQHIYLPQLAAGRYDLQVWKAGGTNLVSTNEAYALAFAFAPIPALAITLTGANLQMTWPIYPAGFTAEATAFPVTGATWSTNNLLSIIVTNQQNLLQLNPTNAPRFFRLVSPNF